LDEIRAVNETAIYDSRALLTSITLIWQTRWVLSTCCGNKTIKGNNIKPLPFNYLVIQRFLSYCKSRFLDERDIMELVVKKKSPLQLTVSREQIP